MASQVSLPDVLGPARYQPYLAAAGGDSALAVELYIWGVELEGAWHSHLSYVEVLVRNVMDSQLKRWNRRQRQDGTPLGENWTAENGAGAALAQLIGLGVSKAREDAQKEATRRDRSHSRWRAAPTHDDIISQMTFGIWSRLLRFPNSNRTNENQKLLWRQCLKLAFPGVSQDNNGLLWIGGQMESLRVLRNRVAHHDNLLQVNTDARLRSSLALLASMGQEYPNLVMARNSLRRIATEDPRLKP